MQESLLPGVSETLGNSSLVDLILTRIEIQMDTWKPNATKLTENEYTEFSPYLSCTMSNWECCFCSTTKNEYTEFSPYLSCTMSNWECCFCSTSNAACRSQSRDNMKNEYKCIYRIITLSFMKMIWERSFCFCIK